MARSPRFAVVGLPQVADGLASAGWELVCDSTDFDRVVQAAAGLSEVGRSLFVVVAPSVVDDRVAGWVAEQLRGHHSVLVLGDGSWPSWLPGSGLVHPVGLPCSVDDLLRVLGAPEDVIGSHPGGGVVVGAAAPDPADVWGAGAPLPPAETWPQPAGPQPVAPQLVEPVVAPQPVVLQSAENVVAPVPVVPQPVAPQPAGPQPAGPVVPQPVAPQPVAPVPVVDGSWPSGGPWGDELDNLDAMFDGPEPPARLVPPVQPMPVAPPAPVAPPVVADGAGYVLPQRAAPDYPAQLVVPPPVAQQPPAGWPVPQPGGWPVPQPGGWPVPPVPAPPVAAPPMVPVPPAGFDPFTATPAAPQPADLFDLGRATHSLCPVVVVMAAKGGVGKTSTAAGLANLAVNAGRGLHQVVLVDMDHGQGTVTKLLRISGLGLPSVVDATGGDLGRAVVSPQRLHQARPSLDELGFGLVIDTESKDQQVIDAATPGLYGRVVDWVRQRADLVVVDTMIAKDDSGTRPWFEQVVMPLLRSAGGWGLFVGSGDASGVFDTPDLMRELIRLGVDRSRLLVFLNGEGEGSLLSVATYQAGVAGLGVWLGDVPYSPSFKANSVRGETLFDTFPPARQVLGRVLSAVTGDAGFEQEMPAVRPAGGLAGRLRLGWRRK